jgi:predicted lipoprotein with Yx(FWY)xxD motif
MGLRLKESMFKKIVLLFTCLVSLTVSDAGIAQRNQPMINLVRSRVIGLGHLVDLNQLSLYTIDPKLAGRSNCEFECMQLFKPYILSTSTQALIDQLNRKIVQAQSSYKPQEWNDMVIGSMPFFLKLNPQTQQLELDGKPLFTFVGDRNPGDQRGDGLMGGGARVAACGGWCWSIYQ